MNLCPKVTKKSNFYLQWLHKPTPSQWYSAQGVGRNTISKVVKTLMENAGIEGFFTYHILTEQEKQDFLGLVFEKKLIKETMGHNSDAIK